MPERPPQTLPEHVSDLARRVRKLETRQAQRNLFEAKGDLLVGLSPGLAEILSVGADGYVPVADASQKLGIRWDSFDGAFGQTCEQIEWKSVATAFSAATVTSIACDIPAGTEPGDILIAYVALDAASAGLNSGQPAGWSLVEASSTNPSMASFWYLSAGSDPPDFTFGWTTAARVTVSVHRFSGVDPVSPIAGSGEGTLVTGTSVTADSLTVTDTDTMLVFLAGAVATITWTPPTGFDERTDLNTGSGGSQTVATKANGPSGATGTAVATLSGSSATSAEFIALRPACSGLDLSIRPHVQARKSGNQAFTANVEDTAAFDLTVYESDGDMHDNATNNSRLYSPSSGLYLIIQNTFYDTNALWESKIRRDGDNADILSRARGANATTEGGPNVALSFLSSGQYVDSRCLFSASGNMTVDSHFSMVKLA